MGKRKWQDRWRDCHPSTRVLNAGYGSEFSENSVRVPLFLTSTFDFPNAAQGRQEFGRAYGIEGIADGCAPGLIYSRINNPNLEIFEAKMTAMEEGAEGALVFPSGMSAITTTVLALLRPEEGKRRPRILYTDPVYGGTFFFFSKFCPNRFGIDTVPVDTSNLAAVRETIERDGPFDMVFIETPANPTISITDIVAVAELVRAQNPLALVAVDNTFAGPVFLQPFRFGADVIVYSATKFIGGHSDLIAGVTLANNPELLKHIGEYRAILGPTTSAFTAWQLTRSLDTLFIRMERAAEVTQQVVEELAGHPKVKRVLYPTLLPAGSEQRTAYDYQFSGPGSIFSFYLKDPSREAAYRLLDSVEIFHLAVSLGGTESLIEHPRTMTHSDMMPAELDHSGITDSMIRVSVGLEHSKDLRRDLRQALEKV